MPALIVALVALTIVLAALSAALWSSLRRVRSGAAEAAATAELSRATTAEANSRVDRLHTALDSVTQGTIIIDAAGRISYRNSFASTFADGAPGHAVVERSLDELLALALEGEHCTREIELVGPPPRTYLLKASPLERGGEIVGALAAIDDVTDQQRLDDMRRDFVANVSHELKTPVGAMAVLAETLVDSDEPEIVARLSTRLEGEARRLGHIIDELLDLSRVESAEGPHAPVVLQDVVGETIDLLRSAAEQHEVALEAHVPDARIVVQGDNAHLRSALMNLTENAISYSSSGGTVGIRLDEVDGRAELAVHDTGIGIPVADHDRIFERFYRVDQARDRGTGGTGLGLSIVRNVVRNHGGTIAVESEDGRGSTFTISLPSASCGPLEQGDRL